MLNFAKRIINYLRFDPKKNRSFTFDEASKGFSEIEEKEAIKEALKDKILKNEELSDQEMDLVHKSINSTNLEQGLYRLDPSFIDDAAFIISKKTIIYDKDTGDVKEVYYEIKDIFSSDDYPTTIVLLSKTANQYLIKVPEPKQNSQA